MRTEQNRTEQNRTEQNRTEHELTGFPSIDKPWLKYYSEEAIQAELPECTIYEYLWGNNKNHLSDTALIYFDKKFSYKELFEEIEKTAKALIAMGIKEGDVVTVITVSCVNSVVLLYALNRIGAISNYINVLASADEYEKYFRDADSKYIFTLDLFAEKAMAAVDKRGYGQICVFSISDYMPFPLSFLYRLKMKKSYTHKAVIMWKDFMKKRKASISLPSFHDCRNVSIYAHTSGTTGFPKTVMHTDYAYNAVAKQYNLCFKHDRSEIFFNMIVPFVTYGMLTCMHMPLCLGLTLVLIPKYDEAELEKYIRKYRPSHMLGIPSYFIPMLSDEKMKNIDLSCVKTLGAGGEGFTEKIERECDEFLLEHHSKAKVLMGYGLTEVCSSAITEFNEHAKVGSVGIPLVKNSVRIWNNEQNRECTYEEQGEIQIYSPSLMKGYKGDENTNVLQEDESGKMWLKSGDIGSIDPDGFVYISGRMKRFLIIGPKGLAYKVLPKPIEEVIAKDPDIEEVCVTAACNESGNATEPKAFIVLKTSEVEKQVIQRLKQRCKAELPDYMRPFRYEVLKQMPKNAVGKTDVKALEKMEELR